MKKRNIESKYYSLSDILSRNKIFNFIIGARSVGKTTSALKIVINHFLKTKRQCIWLRRRKNEIEKTIKSGFFNTMALFFPDHTFEIKGRFGLIDGEEFIIFDSLFECANTKSIDYSRVDYIFFDEFIPDDGRYLSPSDYYYEIKACLSFYQTVARGKDQPIRNVKFIFMANALSVVNPYFSFFDIDKLIRDDTKFLLIKEKSICVQIYRSEAIADEIRQSEFGKLISGTAYDSYSNDNKFLLDNNEFVEKMTGECYYFCTLIITGQKIGVYKSEKTDILYMTNKVNDECELTFTFSTEDHKPNIMLLSSWRTDERIKVLKKCYDLGFIRFDSLRIKKLYQSAMGLL